MRVEAKRDLVARTSQNVKWNGFQHPISIYVRICETRQTDELFLSRGPQPSAVELCIKFKHNLNRAFKQNLFTRLYAHRTVSVWRTPPISRLLQAKLGCVCGACLWILFDDLPESIAAKKTEECLRFAKDNQYLYMLKHNNDVDKQREFHLQCKFLIAISM